MANQIIATVYQIDGNPIASPIQVSFLTSDIMIKEAAVGTIPSVNAAIFYYPNTSNKLQDQVFYVSETLTQLRNASNVGTTSQVQATVLEINEDPQVPGGVQYTFPVENIAIWESINVVTGVNSLIQYKNKYYAVAETEAALVTASNVVIPAVTGLFAQTGNSTPISGTTTETTLINGGVGTLSVPANGFAVGDSFRVVMGGAMSAANNQTIRIKVKSGSIIFIDSGAQPLTSSILNDVWELNVDFTVRQVGAAGVASIVTIAKFAYTKQNNNTVQGFGINAINNTTFDTTIGNTLDITVQWGSSNAGNSIYSDIFILNKTY
jgi:hypothetical protein